MCQARGNGRCAHNPFFGPANEDRSMQLVSNSRSCGKQAKITSAADISSHAVGVDPERAIEWEAGAHTHSTDSKKA